MIYLFVIIYVILLHTCMLEFFKYPILRQIVPQQRGHSMKIIGTLLCNIKVSSTDTNYIQDIFIDEYHSDF